MPSLAVTTTTTAEVKLVPTVKRKLMTELKTFAALKDQLKAVEAAMDKHKGNIAKLQDEIGEQSIAVEGFRVTLVAPVRSVLNKQKLVALGCAATWIEEATESVPGRAYVKITTPGEKGDDT